jgi:hypothetical protein
VVSPIPPACWVGKVPLIFGDFMTRHSQKFYTKDNIAMSRARDKKAETQN